MATQGTYTAYRRLKPLEGDISQDIQQQEENGFRRRTLDQAEQREKNDQLEKEKAREKPIKLPDTPYSEYVSHDKRTIDLFTGDQNFIKEYADNEQALIKDPYNSQFMIKKRNMDNAIEQIAKAQSGISGKSKVLQDGLSSGEFSPSLNKDYIKNYNSLIDATGYSYKLNKNTGVVSVEVPDANGDGIPDEFSLQDAYDPTKLTSFKSKFKDEAYLESAKKRYGKFEDIKDGVTGNYLKTVDKGFDPSKVKDLYSDIDSLFGSDASKMTDQAKSYLADTLNVDPSKVDDVTFNTMKRDFGKRIINSYDTTRERSIDSRDQNADQSRAQSERHFQQTRADENKPKEQNSLGAENINQVGIVKGNQKIKGTAIEKANGAKVFSVQGTNLERAIGKKGAYERVQNIYVMPNGKDIALDVDRVDGTVGGAEGEAKTSNTVKVSYSSNKDAQIIADFVTKKINPKTKKLYKSTEEFMEDAFNIKLKKENKAPKKEDLRSKYNY